MVVIEKAGEIIPAVVRVVMEKRLRTRSPSRCSTMSAGCARPAVVLCRRKRLCGMAMLEFRVSCASRLEDPAVCVTQGPRYRSGGRDRGGGSGESRLCRTPLDLFTLDQERLASLNLGSDDEPRRFGEKNMRQGDRSAGDIPP